MRFHCGICLVNNLKSFSVSKIQFDLFFLSLLFFLKNISNITGYVAIVQADLIRLELVIARAEAAAWRSLALHHQRMTLELEGQVDTLREKVAASQRPNECSICLVRVKNVVFMPFKRLCACMECSENVAQCPICRGLIHNRIRAYL